MPEKLQEFAEEYRCFIDGNIAGDSNCAFDGEISQCDEALDLNDQGLCKKDCQHWRLPEAVMAGIEREAQHRLGVALTITEARSQRTNQNIANAELEMQIAGDVQLRNTLKLRVKRSLNADLRGIPVTIERAR